jgi:zinc/manganese transport system permease protein
MLVDIFAYPFMQNAFLAGSIVAILAGVVGVFVIARGLSFITHTFADIGFSGAAMAVYLGWNPLYGFLLFTVSSAMVLAQLGLKVFRRDVANGVVLSFFLGLGILFLSLATKQVSSVINLLFGSIFGISRSQAYELMGLSAAVLVVLFLGYRMLLFDTFDPAGAEAKGLPVRMISTVFLFLLSITVVGAAQLMGTLLVFTLTIIPAASARHLTHRVPRMMLYAAFLALIGVWVGLFLGYYTNAPVTFYIATVETLIYVAATTYQKIRNRRISP